MSRVLVGATLPQFSDDPTRLHSAARAAEEAGLDSLWLFDHLWPLSGGKERPILECWTTLAWLLGSTKRIRIGTLVARSTLRRPALLAKMAATVGAMAPGRVMVALGSGDEKSRAENEAFGVPYYEGMDRIDQLEVTAKIVHEYLSGRAVTVDTPFGGVTDLPPSPTPDPSPSLWLGGRSDDVLAIAARYADGWNGWGGSAERFAADAQQVLDYAGDRPLELSWGGIVTLVETESDARDLVRGRSSVDRIVGGPESVAEELRPYVDAGARELIATPAGSTAGPDFYRSLARVKGLLN